MSQTYSGKSRKDSSTMKKSKLSLLEKRKIKREKKKKRQIYKMLDEHGEEEDEKTKRDLEILKKYHKKETLEGPLNNRFTKCLMNTEKNKMKRPSATWEFLRITKKKKLKM